MKIVVEIAALLHLAYYKRGMYVKEGAEWVSRKIERSWNKLCPEAKEIMKEKYDSVKIVLKDSYGGISSSYKSLNKLKV